MKIATAAYPIEWHNRWNDYVGKLRIWVRTGTEQGAAIMVFPEYAAMEVASLAGEDNSRDLRRSVDAVVARIGDVDDLHSSLAREFGVVLCAASAPVRRDDGAIVNRARLFAPDGGRGHQDKLALTRFEREEWGIRPGAGLRLFETAVGRIGVLLGEDATQPALAAALAAAGADLLLVPGQTATLAEYWRLRIGAMARATECRLAVALAPAVGDSPWLPALEKSIGTAALFVPPGTAGSDDGILASGKANTIGWTTAEIDPAAPRVAAGGDVAEAPDVPVVERVPLGEPLPAAPAEA